MLKETYVNFQNRFLLQRSLFISIFWGSTAGVLGQGLNFLTNIFLARLLSVEYATLVLYNSTNVMLQGFAHLGLNVFATVLVARNLKVDKERLGQIIPNMYFVVLLLSVIISFVSLTVNFFQIGDFKLWNLESPILLFFIILWFIASTLDVLQVSILAGLEAFKDIAKVSLVKGLSTIIIVATLASLYGVKGVIVGYALSFSLSFFLNLYFLKSNSSKYKLKFTYKVDYSLIGRILKSSFPIFLASLVIMPSQWAINYLIYNRESGKLALTVFGIANQWMILIQFFPLQISKVILPLLSKQRKNRKIYIDTEKTGLVVSLCVSLSLVVLSLFFESSIINMYNIEYSIAKNSFRILLLAALFSTVNLYLGQSIVASGRVWLRTIVDALISISLFVTFALIVSRSVMLSLPIAYCLSFLLGSTAIIYFKKKYNI